MDINRNDEMSKLAVKARQRIVAVLSTQHPEIPWPVDTMTNVIEEVLRDSNAVVLPYYPDSITADVGTGGRNKSSPA